MAVRSETLQVSGIRCERCVQRLATALRDHEGLELANEERTDLDALLAAMAKAGFRPSSTTF
jgi:copper chaperone CopZ